MSSRRLSFTIPQHEHKIQAKENSIYALKEIHNTIKYDWPRILENDANPIEFAISLLDDSSVGMAHRLKEFQRMKNSTEKALRSVVKDHYELFNNSIGSYHMLLSTLNQSQQDSEVIKTFLDSTHKELSDRSAVLAELSETSARYSESIDILDAMTELNKIPEEIDQLITEKKIHEIYDVIAKGYKLAEKYSLWSLPAMNTIKIYLEQQSNKLYDMIVDELQNEIYMKNSRSVNSAGVSSWQALMTSNSPFLASFIALLKSENLEQYVHNSANLDITETVDYLTTPVKSFISNQLPRLHKRSISNDGSIDYKILLDSTSNPNNESFYYIYMLLLTASKLGRLSQVVNTLIESNHSEINDLISRTTEAVKSRNGHALSKLSKIQYLETESLFDIIGRHSFNDSAVIILQELFGSVVVKSLMTIQKHKVISQIVSLIEQDETHSKKPHVNTEGLMRVWESTKLEVKNLILNYIHDDKSNKILDPIDQSKKISRQNKLFEFENVDWGSTKSAQEFSESLVDIFPGFHLDDDDNKEVLNMRTPYFEDEAFSTEIEVLVPKNLLNMRIILESFLIFIEGTTRIFSNFSNNTSNHIAIDFFNEFMRSNFMTYFKETIDVVFGDKVGGSYAFDSKPNEPSGLKLDLLSLNQDTELQILSETTMGKFNSNFTVYENAFNFKKLFLELCLMFNTSMTYRADISNSVLQILQNFATEYQKLFQDLLSNEGSGSHRPILKISKWMKMHTLTEISGTIILDHSLVELQSDLPKFIASESGMLLQEFQDLVLNKDDLLDEQTFSQVVYLLLTTTWILSWLILIKKQSNRSVYDDEQNKSVVISTSDKMRYNWSFLENGRSTVKFTANSSDILQHNICLALNSDKMIQFDDVISCFESIKDQTLLALRYELRSKALYYINLSFNVMNWVPTTEPGDADPYIVTLNQEVFNVDNKLGNTLKEDDKESIFIGYSQFLNDLIIQGSTKIHKINANGVKRILLNISTLQQMLRSLSSKPELIDFNKSTLYFEMFALNEFSLLSKIKSKTLNFTKSQYYNLARLIYSEKLADGNGSSFNKGKYNDLIKKIDDIVT
ncbi:SEC8 [Candida jiufengensis]|uniref:SEC8 n=1 Tax=Candida jiufengensis TaxID=497108 RepID=UPI00222544EB|nr:SEC8 [Candida jiufengensis]KAI5956783.1 SEC8 [Candida jiufengensis]